LPASNSFTDGRQRASALPLDQSLPPELRLHHPWEYRRFFNQSQVVRLSECTVFRVQNDLGHFRLGITLKSRGRSVDRNRVKRQIRESFRQQRAGLGAYDYNVVIPGHRKMLHPYPTKLGQCLMRELAPALAGELRHAVAKR
jgi:ribonuclease P protein component